MNEDGTSKDLIANSESLGEIRRSFNAIKAMAEEKKSISEDIREEKQQCAKKTGVSVRNLNSLFKIMNAREKGEYSNDLIKIAEAVENSAP